MEQTTFIQLLKNNNERMELFSVRTYKVLPGYH